MKYLYYPGCSLEGTAIEYNLSTRSLMQALDVELIEIDNWTCCGASAAEATSRLLSLALPARVLALAEAMGEPIDILVPCSACYLNLKKVEQGVKKDPDLLARLNEILSVDDLTLKGSLRVRHLLDVMSQDLGAAAIAPRVLRRLEGFRIAPYYGCQCLRPYAVFDDPEAPTSMEPLIRSTGADVHPWHMAGRCCGAAHMNTKTEVALELVNAILTDARGADAIVTVCPMCQMNLEAYQRKIAKTYAEEAFEQTILYLPQLLGWAMGLSEQDLRIDLNLAVSDAFRTKLHQTEETRRAG